MYRYNRFTSESLFTVLIVVLILSVAASYVVNTAGRGKEVLGAGLDPMAYIKAYTNDPFRIRALLEEKGVYDEGAAGTCLDSPYECDRMIREGKKFHGVCGDFSAMFAYYYIKAGFGDPVIVIEQTKDGAHMKAVWLDERSMVFHTYWDERGEVLKKAAFASDLIPRLPGATPSPADRLCLSLIKSTGQIPREGESVQEFLNRYNGGKVRPVVIPVGITYVRVKTGLANYENLTATGSCRIIHENVCPLTAGGVVKIEGLRTGVCRIGDFIILVKGGKAG